MKIVMIAPTPGAAMLIPTSPRRGGRSCRPSTRWSPGGLHDPDAQLIDDFQQQRRERDDHERPEDGLRQAERGAGEGGGVAADQAGDELEAEEDQHHEDRDAEQQVVDAT
jgi:hypothetical protein